jgi:predicted nuclease with TOPRIM domain
MSTPIEVLFHHGANCSCEQCQKTVKPFRNGKFFSREEIEQINDDLQSLVKENSKLQAMLEKLTEEKVETKKLLESLQQREVKEEEETQEVEAVSKPSRNLTITIDTSNLFYIAVIAILLIMVLKK